MSEENITGDKNQEEPEPNPRLDTDDGEVVGRDETVKGDEVGGDKVVGDKSEVDVGSISDIDDSEITIAGRDIRRVETGTYIEHATYITAEPEVVEEAPAPGASPYKGLQPFDIGDADIFFGRQALTAKLVGHLREQRFLAVVGASGSGKSSVVRAGMVPALKSGDPLTDGTLPPAGSQTWQVRTIKPTPNPLKELAVCLTNDLLSVRAITTLMDDLASDSRSLDLAVSRTLKRLGGEKLLLIVDQFEELFAPSQSEDDRKAFIDNLIIATQEETAGSTIVVITLRADFYHHCSQYEELRLALERQQAYIGPMTEEELRQAIEGPAAHGNWQLEPGLADLILREIRDEPGALPLLSHVLRETWRRRKGRQLTLGGYHEAGGVHGAIAKTADAIYKQLSPESQEIARNIFLRLIELGEGTQDTRRRVGLEELIPAEEQRDEVQAVLKILADARLVTTAEEYADLAHEALIREWPMLGGWLDEDREGLRIRNNLNKAAIEWQKEGEDTSYLYSGARLASALEWSETRYETLNPLEREFLETSREFEQRQVAEREAQMQRELETARRLAEVESQRAALQQRNARRWQLIALAVVSLTIALVTSIVAVWQFQQAEARRLTDHAQDALNQGSPELATLLALEAVKRANIPDTQEALANILYRPDWDNEDILHVADQTTGSVESIARSNDNHLAIGHSFSGGVVVWDLQQWEPTRVLTEDIDSISSLAWSEAGRLAISTHEGDVSIWNIETGTLILTRTVLTEGVNSVAWVGNRHLAVGGCEIRDGYLCKQGEIVVWDLPNDEMIQTFDEPIGEVLSVDAYSRSEPQSQSRLWYLAAGAKDGRVIVWDLQSWETVQSLEPQNEGDYTPILSVDWSPDGRLAFGTSEGNVGIWRDREPTPTYLEGHQSGVTSVAWSFEGKLASGSYDGRVILWDTITGTSVQNLKPHQGSVNSLEWTLTGDLMSGSSDYDRPIRILPSRYTTHTCTWLERNLWLEEWFEYVGPLYIYQPICPQKPKTLIWGVEQTETEPEEFYQDRMIEDPSEELPVNLVMTLRGRLILAGGALVGLTLVGLIIFGLTRIVRRLISRFKASRA